MKKCSGKEGFDPAVRSLLAQVEEPQAQLKAVGAFVAAQPPQQSAKPVAWWVPEAEQFCLPPG